MVLDVLDGSWIRPPLGPLKIRSILCVPEGMQCQPYSFRCVAVEFVEFMVTIVVS